MVLAIPAFYMEYCFLFQLLRAMSYLRTDLSSSHSISDPAPGQYDWESSEKYIKHFGLCHYRGHLCGVPGSYIQPT